MKTVMVEMREREELLEIVVVLKGEVVHIFFFIFLPFPPLLSLCTFYFCLYFSKFVLALTSIKLL